MANIPDIQIGKRLIGQAHKPFIIAEMSGNHNQSLETALKIVDAAAAAGVDALKIQTYTADTMTLNNREGEFFINDKNSLWVGNSLYELYQQAYTPWEWHLPIFERCRKHGIIGFSTPFDQTAVDFLETLEVPAYKIASFENNDIPLIEYTARTGKPLIISTGMASLSELDDCVTAARDNGCSQLILLKCTSSYPAPVEDANLRTIPHMRELFNCQVGLSDHTLSNSSAITSVALGATIIEKHFTLDRTKGGVDSNFSLEPDELTNLVNMSTEAYISLGSIKYGSCSSEFLSKSHRRSIYVSRDVSQGETISNENIQVIRPGNGLSPKYYKLLIGRSFNKSIKKGTPLTWDSLSD
ncbi:MAG: pseudaminic acid synthase [Gammaproteobacteria bacterium]|nr:pseudaminic acid synthase [Gammaproteobacteria bacterium]